MNERKLFDNGFFEGIRQAKKLKIDPLPKIWPEDPFDIGYLLGVIYFNEKKDIQSSNMAWAEVSD